MEDSSDDEPKKPVRKSSRLSEKSAKSDKKAAAADEDMEGGEEEGKRELFVGNLTFQTTEEQVREYFEYYGTVTNVKIPYDRNSGKSKGMAFVEF